MPDGAFVNDIRADLFDPNTVYIALDNHKFGDFTPYLLKSTDRGRTWRSIASNIPDRHLVWRMVQDHENPNLLFAATEFALFFTLDGGNKWVELSGGAPTIAFRDVAIQRREDDLVAATFGRGFYILDDISPLRNLSEARLQENAMLFAGRDALWYIPKPELAFSEGGSQGHGYFRAPNPPFGANFTYYLADDVQSLTELRQEREKPLIEDGRDTPFPDFGTLTRELQEIEPAVWLTVRDSDGNVVRRIQGPAKAGFHRVNWDLRYPDMGTTRTGSDGSEPSGFLVAPGQYTVSLSLRVRGQTTQLVGPQPFNVVPLRSGALPAQPDADQFWANVAQFDRAVTAANGTLNEAKERLAQMQVAAARIQGGDPDAIDARFTVIRTEVLAIDELLNGNEARNAIYERTQPTVRSRLGSVMWGLSGSTYGPTQTQREQFDYARADFAQIRSRLTVLVEQSMPAFEAELQAAGAPWTQGSAIPAN